MLDQVPEQHVDSFVELEVDALEIVLLQLFEANFRRGVAIRRPVFAVDVFDERVYVQNLERYFSAVARLHSYFVEVQVERWKPRVQRVDLRAVVRGQDRLEDREVDEEVELVSAGLRRTACGSSSDRRGQTSG